MEKILPIAIPAVVVILFVAFILSRIKTASGNEALVVSGVGATDKEGNPRIIRAGGRIVWPFLQQYKLFDCCIRTTKVEKDVTKTKTGVPICLNWAVEYGPDTNQQKSLQKAVCNFLDKDEDELRRVVLDIVSGGVRAVIAQMTPAEVMREKDQLDDKVKTSIEGQMAGLGLMVTLSIHEVDDAEDSTYYRDLAAEDRENKRRDAENITAEAKRSIREKAAETDKAARQTELEAEVQIAAKQRDADMKKAEFKAETDRKNVQAEQAGPLEQQEMERQLATKQGAVEIERQNQADLAAQAAQKVAITKAETDKKSIIIKAQAEAESKKTAAEGEAAAAATRKTREAEANATAKKTQAAAEAEAVKVQAEADASAIRAKGEAEAAAIAAKGKAEAEAIAAKGKAEAEAARELSDAQAANDRVNFELRKIEIEQNTRVQVATSIATVMAEVGKNAKFVDMGGGEGGDGDLLSRVMGNIPGLFAKANITSDALNGEDLTEVIKKLVGAVAGPIKGEGSVDGGDKPTDGAPDGKTVKAVTTKKPSSGPVMPR